MKIANLVIRCVALAVNIGTFLLILYAVVFGL